MARSFRVYQKKRGNRRTGSRTLGSLGELVFFALFFLAGCGGIVILLTAFIIPEWRVNHEFVETTCTVRDKELGRTSGDEGDIFRPEIQIEYEIAGRKYVTKTYDITGAYSSGRDDKQAILDQFEIGRTYPCWYNPLDPNTAVLVRGYSFVLWLLFAVPVAFLLLGGGGFIYRLLHWGKSAERRAAGELFEFRGRGEEFPNVPAGADMTNSPGTRLQYRLPISASAAWALATIGVFCLIWNGIVAVIAFFAWRGLFGPGPVEWVPVIFLVPFALAGIFLAGLFIRQLLLTTGVGQTFVEISDHPLFPGERYELLVSQAGRLRINSLKVLLVCEETVTYRQGTDVRKETKCVYSNELLRHGDFEIQHGRPFEERCEMQIPAAAMHSFKSPNNEIAWKISVAGEVARWPDYERCFPVVVYPGRLDKRRQELM